MPSPFPGMDPYLESPGIWPDFHEHFASELGATLNQTLPKPYYARLELRPEVGIVEEAGARRRVVPDVSVVRARSRRGSKSAVGVLELPRREVSASYEVSSFDEPLRHQLVEIRDPTQGHKLITLIEIASPSNKRRGPDYESYRRKQQEVLASDASLIEVDLLRDGERLFPGQVAALLAGLSRPASYVVTVNRAWRRGTGLADYEVFPIAQRDVLPCIRVPLKESAPEVPLDLQVVFTRAYQRGPYLRGGVDYSRPPEPPLARADARWAARLVKGH